MFEISKDWLKYQDTKAMSFNLTLTAGFLKVTVSSSYICFLIYNNNDYTHLQTICGSGEFNICHKHNVFVKYMVRIEDRFKLVRIVTEFSQPTVAMWVSG